MLNLGSLYCLSTLCGLKAENRETEQQDVCFQDPPKKSRKALMTWLDIAGCPCSIYGSATAY